jgi:CDGSH-type Zn-finger protein
MREVTHTDDGPYIVTPEDIDDENGDVAVCRCGLSDEYPFCDGNHRATEGEEPGVRYKYVDGERREVRLTHVDDGEPVTDAGASGADADG